MLASGCLLMLAGLVLILQLDVSLLVRVPLAVIWTGEVAVALFRLARGQSRVCCLILSADGGCLARDGTGEDRPLQALRNSLLTQNLAWLRFRSGHRQVYAELFMRGQVEAEAWRRLQVIWRWGGRTGQSLNDN